VAKDSRLEKLREMEPVIGTFTARDILDSPEFVRETYSTHAETHMSLGDTSSYLLNLNNWIKKNKGAVVGAISGEYGYGKTSIAIHLWYQLELEGIIAVPPFSWVNPQEIIDATWGWVRYKIKKIYPKSVDNLDSIYEKYREKSIQEFADEKKINRSTVIALVNEKTLHLESKPENTIAFLAEINDFLEGSEMNLCGPIVFTDELQATMSRYFAKNQSRDEFMQDLFELVNMMVNKQGSFGIIISMPTNTETLISDVRADIQQRLQRCNLFVRPSDMYDRNFPKELWQKYSEVFGFQDLSKKIISDDALESIGQISFRNDLGAGPRSVIQSFQYAIDYYDKNHKVMNSIDLINAYLDNQIAIASSGKLVNSIKKILVSSKVKEINKGDDVIKLMAAHPMGCPEDIFNLYQLQDAKEDITRNLYTEYLYKYPEGISLRSLAETERPADPRFIELTKEFIQTYSESKSDIDKAINGFRDLIIEGKLIEGRTPSQIVGWVKNKEPNSYIGTFDKKFPERRLKIIATNDATSLSKNIDEFGLFFFFDPTYDHEDCGKIEYFDDNNDIATISLNILKRPEAPIVIPFIEEFGFPINKVTPTFLLSLAKHLEDNMELIPEDEKRMSLPQLQRNLIDHSIQLLFNENILKKTEIKGLHKIGLELPKEIFTRMCSEKYSKYETFITSSRWQNQTRKYITALSSNEVSNSIGVLRGNRELEFDTRNKLFNLFAENNAQPVKALATNLSNILTINLRQDDDISSTVKFILHPAENEFMTAIRTSTDKIKKGLDELRTLDQYKGFEFLKSLGYTFPEEVGIIIELLQTRRLVDYDDKNQYFIEVIESPDEKRDAIIGNVSELSKEIDSLKEIPDFNHGKFVTKVALLRTKVLESKDVEKLEGFQEKVNQIKEQLNSFIKDWSRKIEQDYKKYRNKTGLILNTGLPKEITENFKSDVGWISEIVDCQNLLEDMYKRSFEEFRLLENKITSSWIKWQTAKVNGKDLLVLYEDNLKAKAKFSEANTKYEASKLHLESLKNWPSVLNSASRTHKEAINCENSYNEDIYRKQIDGVFSEISKNFKNKRLEALVDHEIFANKIESEQKKIDSWLRDRRDIFISNKSFYEKTMKSFGLPKYNLRTTFDAFDPKKSRANLVVEVREKTINFVQTKKNLLGQYKAETLYAKVIINSNVDKLENELNKAEAEIKNLFVNINEDFDKDNNKFEELGGSIIKLSECLKNVEKPLYMILKKKNVNLEEEKILEILEDQKDVDLSLVITSLLKKDSDNFDLDKFMQELVSLFKKNQIILSLRKRR
jgi:hypothetical protein